MMRFLNKTRKTFPCKSCRSLAGAQAEKYCADHASQDGNNNTVIGWTILLRIDSAAMFSAFQYYVGHCQDELEVLELSHLYTIEHYPYTCAMAEITSRLRQACVKPHCRRCASEQGGYVFRWYDRRWEALYRSHARAGAWMPGEDMDDGSATMASQTD